MKLHLVLLVLIGVIPIVLFSFWLLALVDRERRTTFERGLIETGRALTSAVEAELLCTISTLETIAASPALDRDDIEAFRVEAARALETQRRYGWLAVALIGLDGQPLAPTQPGYGPPPARWAPPPSGGARVSCGSRWSRTTRTRGRCSASCSNWPATPWPPPPTAQPAST